MIQPSPLSPSFTHYLPCSFGKTALKLAIDSSNDDSADVEEFWVRFLLARQADVAEYLRNIGAPE